MRFPPQLLLFCGTITCFLILSVTPTLAIDYPAISGNSTYEWITNVAFGSINNNTAQESGGYGDYTNLVTSVVTGRSYPFSVTIHPDPSFGSEYVSVFFDWNQDGDFTDAGEMYPVVANTDVAGPHTTDIPIPADAELGETRMRVVVKWGNTPPSSGNISFGEAEDYTINVINPASGINNSDWISNVTFGNINNDSGQDPTGYGDYIGLSTDAAMGETLLLSVTVEVSTPPENESLTAFFDWNRDGDFTDPGEEFVIGTALEAGTHTREITVPDNALPETTPMRIVLAHNETPRSSGHVGFGEVEDYSINVKPPSGDNSLEHISNVTFATIFNNTGPEPSGYGYYGTQYGFVYAESSHPLSVTISAGGRTEYITAFIDWNQDRDFDDPGEEIVVANGVVTDGPHTVDIIVPTEAAYGNSKMRIVLKNGSPPSSTGEIGNGEAEDYSLRVAGPVVAFNFQEWITNVTFGSINNDSVQDFDGFGNFRDLVTNVRPGKTYPLSVTIHPSVGGDFITAYFDWNQNGLFNDPGEAVVVSAVAVKHSMPTVVNVTVPDDAVLGKTLMRVIMTLYATDRTAGEISMGEAEDYSTNVATFPWPTFMPAIIAR